MTILAADTPLSVLEALWKKHFWGFSYHSSLIISASLKAFIRSSSIVLKPGFLKIQNIYLSSKWYVNFDWFFVHVDAFIKVSKNRNDFMKTLFLPKTNVIIVRISAHYSISYGWNSSKNFVCFWEKRCLYKIISVFTDLCFRRIYE